MIDSLIPLLSLIALEVILGIDNIIFISILADKLPESQRNKLRYWGIGLAMVMRLCLLALISWILKLDNTLFTITDVAFSGKGLILIFGGLFLIYKSTKEIYHKSCPAHCSRKYFGIYKHNPKEDVQCLRHRYGSLSTAHVRLPFAPFRRLREVLDARTACCQQVQLDC